ncbi:somatostatin receptor type 2-like [Ostrea edulis]|uniref:somatostatin receptor type 2-like n=1 Tax=Ostrea edulis TaxID=37623 RepID=UPI002095629D|nr:somatostatin receptor type 2-like [Ostrea edulis]XP_048762311.1 somatostatin receptor type 2-like [Ostrea edulis]XP_048762312.1 somatostatin receptor type 2-like [Ostrea edulis]XP_048762313.1 somatostatin receptor type 2-like [Ostrea edulis]XP_056017114.1 somatostatin receptor type 2-like [Ostrea edulis]
MAEVLQTLSSITTDSVINGTTPGSYYDCDLNDTKNGTATETDSISAKTVILVSSYSLIFVIGLIGNGLVIYVVLRFAKMKTVTNLYILNLAVSDALFLASLPFLIVTTIIKHWIFGAAMCKIYFVLFSINFFASVFQLTALSADRFLAVCHPVRSSRYRNTTIAFLICLVMWSVSFIVMLPIILYSTTYVNTNSNTNHQTCTILWPEGQPIPADKAFTWYTFLLGFLIPVSLISVLYISVIIRLQNVGPAIKSKERKRSHRKVTRMVLAVISVYVVCWLPYWVFQINLTFLKREIEEWEIYLFNGLTVLQFANSMLNPLLYAFLSENFRRSFVKAFQCASTNDVNKSLCHENSVFPKSRQKKCSTADDKKKAEKFEMATMITSVENGNHQPKNGSASSVNEEDELYVDKESQTLQEDV